MKEIFIGTKQHSVPPPPSFFFSGGIVTHLYEYQRTVPFILAVGYIFDIQKCL